MARKSQQKHWGSSSAGAHNYTQQTSTAGNNQVGPTSKAKTIEQLVAPVAHFPSTPSYPTELELSDVDDMLGPTTRITTRTKTTDQKDLNPKNPTQCSYTTVARPWDLQFQIQQGRHGGQNQTIFVVWEKRAPVMEPFHGMGEVAFEAAGRQQDEGYSWMARSRGCKFHIPH